jgi:uncharacterized protein
VTHEAREQLAGPRCPTRARLITWLGNPTRPFCSIACRLIDPGHWLGGSFRMAGAPLSLPDPTAPAETAGDE